MGYFIEGEAICAAAKAYWLGRQGKPDPSKEEALAALKLVTACVDCTGTYELNNEDDRNSDSPLGRLIAIAFDATDEEKLPLTEDDYEDDNSWYDGPLERFHEHFKIT